MLLKLTIQFSTIQEACLVRTRSIDPHRTLFQGCRLLERSVFELVFHFGFVLLQDVFVNGAPSQLLLKSQHRALSGPSTLVIVIV